MGNNLQIMKSGGTSVGNAEYIRQTAEIVAGAETARRGVGDERRDEPFASVGYGRAHELVSDWDEQGI